MRKGLIMAALVGSVWCAGGVARGQDDALARAGEDLQEAIRQHQELSNRISREEGELIGEVQKLDLRVLELTKQLRKLQGEESLATAKRQQLTNELEQRKVEFDYFFRNIEQYSGQLSNRLHVAENQIYDGRLEEIERGVEGAGEDLVAKLEASVPVLNLGVQRLLDLAGGHSFEGKAAGPANEVEAGRFAVFGPIGFFASAKEGEVAGMTSFKAGDVNIPSILKMDGAGSAKVRTLVETGEGSVPVDASLGKAFQIEEGKKSLREFLKAGGVVGYAIILFGFLAVALALFKLVEIMRFRVPTRGEVNEILDRLLAGEEEEAIERASGLPGLAGRVVEAGTRHFFAKRRVLEDALFEKLTAVQPRLDRMLPFLAVIAAAAPMAGLLGTVLGIMKTFDMMAQFGTGDAKYTAGGIGEALITTFLGLVVAIPTIMVHGVLKSYARTRLGQVEGIALAMINGTTELVKGESEVEVESRSKGRPQDDDDEDELYEQAAIEPAR